MARLAPCFRQGPGAAGIGAELVQREGANGIGDIEFRGERSVMDVLDQRLAVPVGEVENPGRLLGLPVKAKLQLWPMAKRSSE